MTDLNELDADNFCGGGGASTGIEAATGRPVDIAVNHSEAAIAMHRVNHPGTRHYREDVWEIDPREATNGRRVRVLWLSPDCFPAGTLVLTRAGYRPIEQVQVDDEVLTHRGRWRRVTETMSTTRPLVRLRGYGHPGLLVSAEHPILARRGKTGRSEWVPASALGPGWYWATPVAFLDDTPVPPVPVHRNRSVTIDANLLWLAGRYVADGWTRLTDERAELVITCGASKVDALRERLAAWPREGARSGADEMAWHERDTATAHQFSTSHRGLVEWLRAEFGHGAANKSIPAWALSMGEAHRFALLDGYLAGDGWRSKGKRQLVQATTVSKALAFGLKALAHSLGHTAAVYVGENSAEIQGRTVNALPSWSVRWNAAPSPAHRQTLREAHLEWAPIRECVDGAGEAEVFNLSVDEDESYVVEGVVAHNCTHHSKAKGGQPREKGVRGLAWVAIRWARTVKPRVILLENVEEFEDWGPIGEDGKPDKGRKGETFLAFVSALKSFGYEVDWRRVVAADHGSPTTRRRLFMVARSDGKPIVWPEATHGKGRAQPWRTAAEIIDWTLPTRSIFGRKKPLADATLARVAAGLRRYVIESANPFIVPVKSWGGGGNGPLSLASPMRTVTASKRGEFALVTPFVAKYHGGEERNLARGQILGEPLRTVDTENRFALVAPTLVQTGYGERKGQAPRTLDIGRPLGTVVSGGKHALVSAFLTKHNGGIYKAPLDEPLSTVTCREHFTAQQVVLEPVEVAFVEKFYGTAAGADAREPLPTVTATGQHLAEVRAFLVAYYKSERDGQAVNDPLRTITTKARLGLVTVAGADYQIVDIGLRMLSPRELFRAQGFGDDYVIDVELNGKQLTKTAQIELAGNSVCPQAARALAGANLFERWGEA